ncbi:MAG: alpha/beta fold hydrolase [Anaerolineales bacterium]
MNKWRALMQQLRNFIIRLSITHLVLLTITVLPGIQFKDALFRVWIASLVFVILTAVLRPVLVALLLPLTIVSAGLFLFVIDGFLLLLTDWLTGLEIASFGWAILGSVVMGVMNIWVQSAFKRLGWMERTDEDDPPEILSPGWGLRILLGGGLLFGLALGVMAAFQVVLALSTLISNLRILGVVGLLSLVGIAFTVAWLVAEGLEANNRARFSLIATIMTVSVTTIGLVVIFSLPKPAVKVPPPPPNVQYWSLPTGSRIAYYAYPAQGEIQETPIVYLHDGPGMAVLDAEREFYRRFAEDGFDVYLYDRIGVGHSGRLEQISAYGLERDLADLDAIRDELGVNEMILIGQGAGAELAARYLGRYPERVTRAIFHSPTPLADDAAFFDNYARTGAPLGPNPVFEPRLLLAAALAGYGPEAAENIASQAEMSVLLAEAFTPQLWVCGRHSALAPEIDAAGATFNYYVQVQIELSEQTLPDPRPALDENLTPSLVLAAECDYIPWGVIQQYQETLLNEKVIYFEGAGHMIQLTQGGALGATIRAFLLEEPYPISPYEGPGNPRPMLGP